MLKTNPRFLSPGFSSLSSGSLHFSPCSACGPGAHAPGLFTPSGFLRGVGVEERAAWVSDGRNLGWLLQPGRKWSEGKTSNRQGWLRHGFPSLGPTHLRSEVFYFILFIIIFFCFVHRRIQEKFGRSLFFQFIGTGLGIHALDRGKD